MDVFSEKNRDDSLQKPADNGPLKILPEEESI